jgi:hypothetical protein
MPDNYTVGCAVTTRIHIQHIIPSGAFRSYLLVDDAFVRKG